MSGLFLAPPDHEEEYQYSGSEEEDEQLLAGMIAEEMGYEPASSKADSLLKFVHLYSPPACLSVHPFLPSFFH